MEEFRYIDEMTDHLVSFTPDKLGNEKMYSYLTILFKLNILEIETIL